MRDYALTALYLLLPFGFLSYGMVHEGQHLAFVLAAVVVIGLLITNRLVSAFYFYLAVWMLFAMLYRLFFQLPPSVFPLLMNEVAFFAAGGICYIAVSRSKIGLETFYNAICAGAVVQSLMAISQSLGFDPVLWFLRFFVNADPLLDPTTMTGSLGNPNFLAAYLAISLPFFFRRKWCWFIPVLAVVLYCSKTTSAFVPAVIGVAYFYHEFIFRGPFRWHYIVGAVLVVVGVSLGYAIFNHTPFYSNPRWSDWSDVLLIWSKSSFAVVFGMGPGAMWSKPYPMHNEWLECLYQFGTIGFSLLAAYVVSIWRGNKMLFTAFLIAAINIFGNYAIHLSPSAFLIIIVAGLIERERTALKGDSTTQQACFGTGRQAATDRVK